MIISTPTTLLPLLLTSSRSLRKARKQTRHERLRNTPDRPECYHLGQNNYKKCVVQIVFELMRPVKSVIRCGFKIIRINKNRNADINSLAGLFFQITDVFSLQEARTFSRPFCPNLRFCFCTCPQCWVSGREVTTSSLSCSSSWTTTRSWRILARIGSTCSTGTPSSHTLQCA